MEFIKTKDLTIIFQGAYEEKTIVHSDYYGVVAYAITTRDIETWTYQYDLYYTKQFDNHTNSIHQYDRQIKKAFRELAQKYNIHNVVINDHGVDNNKHVYPTMVLNCEEAK